MKNRRHDDEKADRSVCSQPLESFLGQRELAQIIAGVLRSCVCSIVVDFLISHVSKHLDPYFDKFRAIQEDSNESTICTTKGICGSYFSRIQSFQVYFEMIVSIHSYFNQVRDGG